MMKIGAFLVYVMVAIYSCTVVEKKHTNRKVNRSFYYWKTVFRLSGFERQRLQALEVNTLYVRFFDVDWDPVRKRPQPVAQLVVKDQEYFADYQIETIPTIFITNYCLEQMPVSGCDSLATNIIQLVNKMCALNNIHAVRQVQIDCDWTAGTREKYFELLRLLQIKDPLHVFSATIRLHQVKFANKTGIPPVQRGLLMCYNMGNLKNPAAGNSIIDPEVFGKYINGRNHYSLPLDIAFPLFEWYVLFRDGSYKGLIRSLPVPLAHPLFDRQSEGKYLLNKDTLLDGMELHKADVIRYERSKMEDILKVARLIEGPLLPDSVSLTLYHLDSIPLSKYSENELENLYHSIH